MVVTRRVGRSSPERIQVAPATTVVLPLTVDIGPCLNDPDRASSEQRGCPLVIELTLADAVGETIDSQTRDSTRRYDGRPGNEPSVRSVPKVGRLALAAPRDTHPADAR